MDYIQQYIDHECWGMSTSIDLKVCMMHKIKDKGYIMDFASALVELLDMEAYGEPIMVRFGKDDKMGYTMIQLIQTSNITAHFAEDINAAYIDVFSCKPYDPNKVMEFCKGYFGAKFATMTVTMRL